MCLEPQLRKTSRIWDRLRSQLAPTEVKSLLKGDLNALRKRCLDPAHGARKTSEAQNLRSCALLQGYSIDHIIPKSRGGKDHPENYFLMPRRAKMYFGNSWTAEKVAYIGLEAALAARPSATASEAEAAGMRVKV